MVSLFRTQTTLSLPLHQYIFSHSSSPPRSCHNTHVTTHTQSHIRTHARIQVPKFTLVFTQNPGYIRQIAINNYVNGKRPSLITSDGAFSAQWHIFANGFTGMPLIFQSLIACVWMCAHLPLTSLICLRVYVFEREGWGGGLCLFSCDNVQGAVINHNLRRT